MARHSDARVALRAAPVSDPASNRDIPLSPAGISSLAARAVARLREQSGAGELSEPARTCMQSPLAIALARALCDDATDTADLLVADLVEAGLSVEEICLDHLAPAAKCLGEWWENDRLPFTEVAMATSRIQAILRRMPAGGRGRHRSFHRGAVFCAVPGEQHTLGVMMAADLFRRNGWDVGLLVGLDHAEILGRLERDDRCVIGLSCSGAHSLAALDRLMQALRGMRPDARLILSGQIVLDPAALARLPAPDAIVRSVAEAEAQIAQLDADLALGRLQRASVA